MQVEVHHTGHTTRVNLVDSCGVTVPADRCAKLVTRNNNTNFLQCSCLFVYSLDHMNFLVPHTGNKCVMLVYNYTKRDDVIITIYHGNDACNVCLYH